MWECKLDVMDGSPMKPASKQPIKSRQIKRPAKLCTAHWISVIDPLFCYRTDLYRPRVMLDIPSQHHPRKHNLPTILLQQEV